MSCLAGFALPAIADEQPITDVGTLDEASAEEAFPAKPPYSPYAGRNFPTRPFFGDTHLHTSFSMDAGAFGCRLDAARCLPLRQRRGDHGFERPAREAVAPARFSRRQRSLGRLWFLSAIDGWRSRTCSRRRKGANGTTRSVPAKVRRRRSTSSPVSARANCRKGFPLPGTPAYRSAWQEIIKAAEEANEPGDSPPSSATSGPRTSRGNNLHRNVIFRDDGRKASQVEPYTTQPPLGSANPRDLWKWMAVYEEKTGGRCSPSRTTAI